MTDAQQTDAVPAARKARRGIPLLIAAASIMLGSAAPVLLRYIQGETPLLSHSDGHGAADHSHKSKEHATSSGAVAYVPLGEILTNLNEEKLARYIRVVITLEVAKEDSEVVVKTVEMHRATLRNWLISRMSDMRVEEVRGAANQSRLRREIRDKLNATMFPDRTEGVLNVLFEECNIQ